KARCRWATGLVWARDESRGLVEWRYVAGHQGVIGGVSKTVIWALWRADFASRPVTETFGTGDIRRWHCNGTGLALLHLADRDR
ncbi:MAG: hypothetical protein ACOC8H_02655, partial [bacterium]